jgi:hypothetical protein
LGVLQGYFKPEIPLKVLATLKNLYGSKYVLCENPLGVFNKTVVSKSVGL